MPSVTLALPLSSVTALAPASRPESAPNSTVAPATAVFCAVFTSAVTVTSVPAAPAEGSSLLLNTRFSAAALAAGSGGVGVGGVGGGGGEPPHKDGVARLQPDGAWASLAPPPHPARLAANNRKAQ